MMHSVKASSAEEPVPEAALALAPTRWPPGWGVLGAAIVSAAMWWAFLAAVETFVRMLTASISS